ncbi:hypothetical protein [Isoptericola croceus]|uniref:hypothetical protein n=1 Tax=Isoptericola croceus TaxID=3031406 RepID=UPI0023F66DF1|nr:hypothetical protein [Isoptericola croceus]
MAAIVMPALLLPLLAGCGAAEASCEKTYEELTLSVPGVITADVTCVRRFGDERQGGTVTVEASTEKEAIAIMEDVLRAYAASPDLQHAEVPRFSFWSEDSTIGVGPDDLDFNGRASLRNIREHYGIEPE